MNLRTKIKHINKKLSKYSKTILTVFSVVGVAIAIFIGSIGEFEFNRADSLAYQSIATLGTNEVFKVENLLGDHLVTFTTQFSETNVEILHHYNINDYSLFNTYETDIEASTIDSKDNFAIHLSTSDIYIVDENTNELKQLLYSTMWSAYNSFAMPTPAENISNIAINYTTQDVFIAQETRLVRFPSDGLGSYDTPEVYNYTNGDNSSSSITIDPFNNKVYVIFYFNSYAQVFDGNNSYASSRYDAAYAGTNIKYYNGSIYLTNSGGLLNFNLNFSSLLEGYSLSFPIDYAVNNDYVYIANADTVVKYDQGDETSVTSSGSITDVDFRSMVLKQTIDDKIIVLDAYDRELFEFELVQSVSGLYGCPVSSPAYVASNGLCHRFTYNSTDSNSTLLANSQSIMVNNTLAVLQGKNQFVGGIWIAGLGYTTFPSNLNSPIRIRADSNGLGAYILFESDSNNSGNPVIAFYDFGLNAVTSIYTFPVSETFPPHDFTVDSQGNMIAVNDNGVDTTTLSYFPVGDYGNPYSINPGNSFDTAGDIKMEADLNGNLYIINNSGAELSLMLVESDTGLSSGTKIDLENYNFDTVNSIFIKNRAEDTSDVYISGSTPSQLSKIHKDTITISTNNGISYSSGTEYVTSYGLHNSYEIGEIFVDQYDNIFGVPTQADDSIVWFLPEGNLNSITLNDVDGYVTDVLVDSNNNLYITSEFINYQLYNHNAVNYSAGGSCNSPYIQNITRCEIYVDQPPSDDSTTPDISESFEESVIDVDTFYASTDTGRIYVDGNFYDLPQYFSGISNLKADKSLVNGIYFTTTNVSDYTHIMHFDFLTQSFDFSYDTQSTQLNVDYDFKSNGDLYVIGQSFSNTSLTEFFAGQYTGANLINMDFDMPGACTPKVRITRVDNLFIVCGNQVNGLSVLDYTTSSFILPVISYFNNGDQVRDVFIKERLDTDIDLYISGSNNSGNGKVHKFTSLNMDGEFNSDFEYSHSFFSGNNIEDIFVENNDSIFASNAVDPTSMVRFLSDGTVELITGIVDYNGIQDIVVDNLYNLYVTSGQYAYQFFVFDFAGVEHEGLTQTSGQGSAGPPEIQLGEQVFSAGSVLHANQYEFPPPYPAGYIEILANNLPIAIVPLNNLGEFTYNFTFFVPGTYYITAFYPGDNNFTSTYIFLGEIIVGGSIGIGLDSEIVLVSANPSNFRQITGENITYQFNVSDPNNPSNIPTGSVELRDAYCCTSSSFIVLGTEQIDSNGDVSFTINSLLPRLSAIYAIYLGDSTYDESNTNSFGQYVYSIQTFTTIQSSENPVIKGDQVTFNANVILPNFTPSVGSPVELEGYVRFTIGTTNLGEVYMNTSDNGNVSLTINTSDLPVGLGNINEGVHHIRAKYLPNYGILNYRLRPSESETLFQAVLETDSNGGSGSGSDIPPSGGEGGNSDFSAVITGRDKVTGSVTQTKIGSILSWVMNYNNLGPNSNPAVTYFPIRENQDFIVGSVQAPVNWEITYSQDQNCDDSTFNYTPVTNNGSTDPLTRCVRFENERVNVPPTRSDIRYINTSASFEELNIADFGGDDIFKVVTYNNKLFYFNHHWQVERTMSAPKKTMFCFDLEINDTCVSNNPNIVYPVVMGLDGYPNVNDEYLNSRTAFAANAEIVNDKMYIPMTDLEFQNSANNGHGFLCWDLVLDYYCNSPGLYQGTVSLDDFSFRAWGFGNVGDIQYNPNLQELYTVNIGAGLSSQVMCFSLQTNAPCIDQPYPLGSISGYDPQWHTVEYQSSTQRIYTAAGSQLDRFIQCMDAVTKTICPDFPAGGTKILVDKPNQSVFLNAYTDEICSFMYSDGPGSDNGPPKIYCYDQPNENWYNYLPDMANNVGNIGYGTLEITGPHPDGKLFFGGEPMYCYDLDTKLPCLSWEGGRTGAPFGPSVYTTRYAFGCMWAATHSGRVFTYKPEDGSVCNPLITLTEGNVAVKLDGNNMFCATSPDDITWNKVKVLDSGTSPSPAILNATVYDSTNCTTDNNNIVSCTGSPLKSGNLLLNSGHELDISDIDYNLHKSLTAILEFTYPAVPTPAPGFYIELNPTNKAQMCAETKLLFSGALCANPITLVCENTNISYINDPVSNNNNGQYCLNVETYFGKDANSSLCFVATTPEQRIFTVFNPNATVAPNGTPVNFNPEETYNRGPGNYSFGNGFFGFFQELIENTVIRLVDQVNVREIVGSVNNQTPLLITSFTAITTGTIVVTGILASGSGIGQVIGVLLGFLTKSRKKYWGIVYDDYTNVPVAFASITLSNKEISSNNEVKTNIVTQAVSDLDGKYRLNTYSKYQFYLEVKASGYQTFTKYISVSNSLGINDIIYDIPLKRLDKNFSLFKSILNFRKKTLFKISRIIIVILTVIGFIFTIYSQINFPSTVNVILILVYLLIFIITFYPSVYSLFQKKGKVIDSESKSPIPGAVVRIYNNKSQIALSLTSNTGEAKFDIPEGKYNILASKRGYKIITTGEQKLLSAVLKKDGYFENDILMERINEDLEVDKTILDNPFA